MDAALSSAVPGGVYSQPPGGEAMKLTTLFASLFGGILQIVAPPHQTPIQSPTIRIHPLDVL